MRKQGPEKARTDGYLFLNGDPPCPKGLVKLGICTFGFLTSNPRVKVPQLIRQDVTLLLLIMFTILNFVTNSHFKERFRVIKKQRGHIPKAFVNDIKYG